MIQAEVQNKGAKQIIQIEDMRAEMRVSAKHVYIPERDQLIGARKKRNQLIGWKNERNGLSGLSSYCLSILQLLLHDHLVDTTFPTRTFLKQSRCTVNKR